MFLDTSRARSFQVAVLLQQWPLQTVRVTFVGTGNCGHKYGYLGYSRCRHCALTRKDPKTGLT